LWTELTQDRVQWRIPRDGSELMCSVTRNIFSSLLQSTARGLERLSEAAVTLVKRAKAVPPHATKRLWGEEIELLSFSTSALYGGEWSASRSGRALAPGKGPSVSIVQGDGWAPEPVWTQSIEETFFRLCRGSNLDRSVVQSVARHYTDWATIIIVTTVTYSGLTINVAQNRWESISKVLRSNVQECFLKEWGCK
jgi:hypothetical protein